MRKIKTQNANRHFNLRHWAWDVFAITIALVMGFGPYFLLSIFGDSKSDQVAHHSFKGRRPTSLDPR